jgi:hypothetical protein
MCLNLVINFSIPQDSWTNLHLTKVRNLFFYPETPLLYFLLIMRISLSTNSPTIKTEVSAKILLLLSPLPTGGVLGMQFLGTLISSTSPQLLHHEFHIYSSTPKI